MTETRYAKTTDGLRIAYRILGDGPVDLVFVISSWWSNFEAALEWDFSARLLRGLAARSRLLIFDRRGTGLSDRMSVRATPTLEARMDDIRAVMDAAGWERAILFGNEDGAALCAVFAASYPERTSAIIMEAPTARGRWAPDHAWGWTDEDWDASIRSIESGFGSMAFAHANVEEMWPSSADDEAFVSGYAKLLRHAMSPGGAILASRLEWETDIRHILPVVQAPTLVQDGVGGRFYPPEEAPFIADRIPGARFELYPDRAWWLRDDGFDRIDRFLGSLRDEEREFDRVLATVLFTDIVGSTTKAAELGDAAWRDLLDRHHATVRALIGRYRGTEIATTGDGFLATFDGPARALRCGLALCEAVLQLGIEIRAGLHTGEIAIRDGNADGIAVHIGARVANLADPSTVFASSTVKDLVAGSGLTFDDAGEHELKGVPGRWRLFRVTA